MWGMVARSYLRKTLALVVAYCIVAYLLNTFPWTTLAVVAAVLVLGHSVRRSRSGSSPTICPDGRSGPSREECQLPAKWDPLGILGSSGTTLTATLLS